MTIADGVLILIIVAVVVLVAVFTMALRRIDSAKVEIKEEVKAVHKIVNQQRTDMLVYQKQLVEALVRSGVHVPTDKSL